MKKISLVLLVLFRIITFGQGMKFEENKSFTELLAIAKKENKLLFVDAFTTWCGPCKMMDKNTFPQPQVGEFYNATFINSKIDMEKGEGIDIAKKYKVMAYPTYLFINGDGEIIHRVTSYFPPKEFLAVGKDAINPTKQMGALKKRFDAGDKDPEFLKSFITIFTFAEPELATKAAAMYFGGKKGQPLAPEDYNTLFSLTKDSNSALYPEFINRKEDFLKMMPEKTYNKIIDDFKMNTLFNTSYDKTTKVFNEQKYVSEASKTMTADDVKVLLLKTKMRVATMKKDKEAYQKLAVEYYKDGTSTEFNSNELNSVAWNFFENATDKALLNNAVLWAKQSVKLKEGYANSDTLANLYFKVGDMANAKLSATKAIELAKKEGEEYADTQAILNKIK